MNVYNNQSKKGLTSLKRTVIKDGKFIQCLTKYERVISIYKIIILCVYYILQEKFKS